MVPVTFCFFFSQSGYKVFALAGVSAPVSQHQYVIRKCHVWVQGYQTLEKQHQNGGEGDRESSKMGIWWGQPSVNCENCIPVFQPSFCLSRLQPLQINLTNFVKAASQSSRLSKCDKQAAKSIMTKPFPLRLGLCCRHAALEAAASQLLFPAAAVSNCFGRSLRWIAIGVI